MFFHVIEQGHGTIFKQIDYRGLLFENLPKDSLSFFMWLQWKVASGRMTAFPKLIFQTRKMIPSCTRLWKQWEGQQTTAINACLSNYITREYMEYLISFWASSNVTIRYRQAHKVLQQREYASTIWSTSTRGIVFHEQLCWRLVIFHEDVNKLKQTN